MIPIFYRRVVHMDIQRFKRRDRDFQYIAARVDCLLGPLPSWFRIVEETGMLRYDSERNVEVRTITGVWRTVEQGDWVVLQRGGDLYHVEHEDFIKTWEAV